MTHRILIIDDERNIHTTLGRGLELEGLKVESAFTGTEGLAKSSSWSPDLILLDLEASRSKWFGGSRSVDGCRQCPGRGHDEWSRNAGLRRSSHAQGSSRLSGKAVDIDRLTLTVANALKLDELGRAYSGMQRVIERRHGMVGRSAAMQDLLAQIHRAAPTKASVLITGQSGVGKELVAKAVHDLSRRNQGAFVKMNCAAIAENLVESELFGHEKGAFTGAERRHQGRFERAHEGTLFLDEVGEMPLATQGVYFACSKKVNSSASAEVVWLR